MPWIPAPFSGGVVWQDRPSVATALSAANLNQEENAEAAYAVALSQSVVDHFTAELAINVMDFDAIGDGVADDTTPVQNAIDAASAIGSALGTKCLLKFTPGKKYAWTSVIPKSYVDIDARGAMFARLPGYAGNLSLFFATSRSGVGAGITQFSIRGATMTGTGSEQSNQGLLILDRSSFITVEDCYGSNVAAGMISIRDSNHIWVLRNKFINCTTIAGGVNVIDLINDLNGSVTPLQHVWVDDNTCEGFVTMGICFASVTGANRTDPWVDAHITNNTCVTASGTTGWPIAIEQGGSSAPPNVSGFDLSGNTCVQNGNGIYAMVLTNDSSALSNDPLNISDVTVRGNRLTSQQTSGVGLLSVASQVEITGNSIKAALHDIWLQGHGTATVRQITVAGNGAHLGSGDAIHLGTGIDTTTLSSGGVSSSVIAALVGDPFGRTGVLTSVGDATPATAVSVSVLDAPFHAKGDAKVVADGSITSGSNLLSSPTATWVNGQIVVVQAVGPNSQPGGVGTSAPGVLIGYVNGISGTTATLVTTSGGSTPANATATLTGTAVIKYGTDDTAAFQAAINAMSSAASILGVGGTVGRVRGADGRAFMVGHLTAKSNVMLDLYGSTVHMVISNTLTSRLGILFAPASNTSITNWHMRGGTFPGTGTESGGGSAIQSVLRLSNGDFGDNGTATYTDISVKDVTVTNWASGPFDIRGGSRLRFEGNTFRNCSTFTSNNTINVIMGAGSVASSDVFIQNNYFDGNGAECIAIGEAFTPTGTFDRAVVTGNICTATGGAAAIDVEWSTATTGTGKTVIIANNIVRNTGTGGIAYCISATSVGNPNPLVESRIIIALNNCDAPSGRGILCSASDAIVTGNFVNALGLALQLGQQNAYSITADTNSNTSLTNVVASASIVNGSPMTGSGIQPGTYLVSGAGTSTWTISLPATTTTAGNALSVKSQAYRMRCEGNEVRVPNTMTTNPISASQLRDSVIARNTVVVDPGTTGSPGLALVGILVNYCGWCDIDENKVNFAAGGGIQVDSSNDVHTRRNRIYNPSEIGVNSSAGIIFTNISGLPFRIEENICIDDRSAHKMQYGVLVGAVNNLAELIDNEIRGAATAPSSTVSNFSLIQGNVSDTSTWPVATSGSTPGSLPYTTTGVPYPSMVSVVGGTITSVQHNRTGSSTRNLATYASTAAQITAYLAPNDTVTINGSVAPVVSVFPMQ